MKCCLTSKRTFEDIFTFCLVDGAILSAPYRPQDISAISRKRETVQQRTELLPNPGQRKTWLRLILRWLLASVLDLTVGGFMGALAEWYFRPTINDVSEIIDKP